MLLIGDVITRIILSHGTRICLRVNTIRNIFLVISLDQADLEFRCI